ncbi:MAG: hypothetical protein FWF79_04735, partial [Defluviitaleaceae bacterium]|nr:hypothetical protein [Defluviitaleaceae bacterium]
MAGKISEYFRKLTIFVLVLTMLFPAVVRAGESPWLNMPEIAPFDVFNPDEMHFPVSYHMDEFNFFASEFSTTGHGYIHGLSEFSTAEHGYIHGLTQLSPEEIEAFLHSWEQHHQFDYDHPPDGHLSDDHPPDGHPFEADDSSLLEPLAGVTHADIIANPFNLQFNYNDFVSLNTGASVFRKNVLTLPGRGGFGLNLNLVYNSAYAYPRRIVSESIHLADRKDMHGLGIGWRFDLPYIFDDVLYVPGRGKFTLMDNRIVGHNLQDIQLRNDSSFTSGNKRSDQRLLFHNGTSYFFSNGRIIGMVDRFGNTIRFEYVLNAQVSNGQILSRIIDTNGKIIQFQHQVSGNTRTLSVISPDRSSFNINMTALNQAGANLGSKVTSVQNQVGAVTSFNYQTATVRFDIASKNPHRVNLSGHLLLLNTITHPSGARVNLEYTRHTINLGRAGSRYAYRVTARTLHGFTETHGWRQYLRATFQYQGDHTAFPQQVDALPRGHSYSVTVTQNNGLSTHYRFNNLHLNVVQRTYINGNFLHDLTTEYNSDRLPTAILFFEVRNNMTRGNIQRFTYNQFGQVLQSTHPSGKVVNYSYDSRYGLLTNKRYRATSYQRVYTNVLSPDGRSIIRSHISGSSGIQSATEFSHDAHGNITEIREFPVATGASFITTQITFDRGTLPSSIRTLNVRDANNALVGGTGVVERRFTYDSMWRTLSETDPEGYVTRWIYDAIGRVTHITFPNGGISIYTHDDTLNRLVHRTALGALYVYQYDGFGNLLSVTTADGVILRNVYDNRMRLVETFNALGINSSQRTLFTYDALDRVILTVNLDPTTYRVIRAERTHFDDLIDSRGNSRVTTTVSNNGFLFPSTQDIQTFSQYDWLGRRTYTGTVGGRVFSYAYNPSGQVIREISDGVYNSFRHTLFGVDQIRNIEGHTSNNVFDGMGRIIASSDFMGNYTRFTYDELGRLIRLEVPFERIGGVMHYAITRYFYDLNGNLTRTETL